MPLYYFHVYNDDVTMDEEGQDFPDAAAARVQAVKSVRELICDDVRKGRVTLSDRIEVEDAHHRPMLTLTYGETVEIKP